ncbi:MAG: hypothetical protein BGO41_01635 [Clostridiales bacterium 38-18]|nr:MAG: hypothetical protein BGO41_01635 [Clostridiales bacterium 38-18]
MTSNKAIGSIELETFKRHFTDYKDQYVLIGGSATKLLLEDASLSARSTKDLDLVLCAKALTKEFKDHFWTFIKEGKYRVKQSKNDNGVFYRFDEPKIYGYPYMIELLSGNAELDLSSGQVAYPIEIDGDIVSLSAIIMNQEYYDFLMSNRKEMNGIVIADEHVIIPLKITAFLDLTRKKAGGNEVNGDDIKKHKNDVVRLAELLTSVPMKKCTFYN